MNIIAHRAHIRKGCICTDLTFTLGVGGARMRQKQDCIYINT